MNMNNKFKLRIFLIGVVAIALAMVSFLFLDYNKLKKLDYKADLVSFGDRSYLVKEGSLETIEKLDLDLINSDIEIQESDSFSYKIYSNQKNLAFEDYLDLQIEESVFKLKEKNRIVNNSSKILIEAPKGLLLKLDSTNSNLKSNLNFKSIALDITNGNAELSGQEDYDMDIDITNGLVDLKFENYNGNYNLSTINGSIDMMGEKEMLSIGGVSQLESKKGRGDRSINIDIANGIIDIGN